MLKKRLLNTNNFYIFYNQQHQGGQLVPCLHHLMKIVVDYVWLGKLENEIRNSPYSIKNINYADRVEFFVFVPKEEESSFTEWLVEMTNGQATITRDDILFLEFEKSN